MVVNPLFIQNNSSRDSAMLSKAGGLKGKGYLFSDMMQVYLGSKAGAPSKFEQLLSSNTEIDADETKSNLFKLTEGNIPSQNDVKFELLLQFLGVTSEEFPEQTGLSLEIPKVSSEELQSMLAKITANADNEGELNKVIYEKLLKSSEENGENLLVTLQFNNKTIAIDIVPGTATVAANNANQTGSSDAASSGKSASVFNMTVSILPSDVSDDIISKFVDSTHLLKKEAEGTAQLNSEESNKTKLIQNNDQIQTTETKASSPIDGIISKVSESAPDLAKKITIYSVVNSAESTETNTAQNTVETTFTNPLKQIKYNSQTASLVNGNSSSKININPTEASSNKDVKVDPQIPKAGSSFVAAPKIKEAEPNADINVKTTVNSSNNDLTGKVIKESDIKNNVTKPSVETFASDSKVISSSEQSQNKETLSAQVLKNLVDSSDKKTENQSKVSVKVDNNQQAVKNVEENSAAKTKTLNETELELPANEKVKISIKKENVTVKTSVPIVKPEVEKATKDVETIKQNSVTVKTEIDGKVVETAKQASGNAKQEASNLKNGTNTAIGSEGKVGNEAAKQETSVKQEASELKNNTTNVKPIQSTDGKVIEANNQFFDKIKAESANSKPAVENTTKGNAEFNQTVNKDLESKIISDQKTDSVSAKEFEKVLKTSDKKVDTENKNVDVANAAKEKSDKNPEAVKVSQQENGSDKIKDEAAKVQKAVENSVIKENISKEKTEEIVKENPVKPNEVVKAKSEAEPDKPLTNTTTKDGDVLREISGTNSTSSEQKHSHKQGDDNQANNFIHQTHNVDSTKAKTGFDEAMANNQPHKVVKQSEVVKEVHQFVERKDSSQLVLKVEPADLGKVKVTLEMIDKIVKVNVEVESDAIKQALEKSMNDLSQLLNKSGLQLGSVNISLQNADKGNKQNQPNKKKTENKAEGGDTVENETGETQAGKSLGYNTYDYVV